MADDLVSLGLVVGLDHPYRDLDVHALLQSLKRHPLLDAVLSEGELVEWGAKTIPEGGYHAIPDRLHGDGLLIVGDAAGLVDVATLKGIHYAMRSGILAAQAIYGALAADDPSGARLAVFDERLRASLAAGPLYRNRNMRLAFKSGLFRGGARALVMQLTGGRFPGARVRTESDVQVARTKRLAHSYVADGARTFDKVDAVFRAGNATRDDIPSHLVVGDGVPPEMAEFYEHLCPAGVYERQGDELVVNPPNCVDCKATDIVGPRWLPREGGSGPSYKRM
jgi:electron-transferring-flavoprotein dehydrogenase